jgi:dihydroorotate dehydrogenase
VMSEFSKPCTSCPGGPDRRIPLLIKIAPDLTADERQDVADVALKTKADGLIVSNTTVSRPSSLRVRAVLRRHPNCTRHTQRRRTERTLCISAWWKSVHKDEMGGLSGAPLKDLATFTVADMYRRTRGQIPIIGVGGVGTAEDAYEKIKAGASLVQVSRSDDNAPKCWFAVKSDAPSIHRLGYPAVDVKINKIKIISKIKNPGIAWQVYSMLVYEGPGSVRRIKEGLAGMLRQDVSSLYLVERFLRVAHVTPRAF